MPQAITATITTIGDNFINATTKIEAHRMGQVHHFVQPLLTILAAVTRIKATVVGLSARNILAIN